MKKKQINIDKAKELTNEMSDVSDLLNQSVEVIMFLENLAVLSKDEDKEYIENFFEKLKEYIEGKNNDY